MTTHFASITTDNGDNQNPNIFCKECGRLFDRMDELWIQCDNCDDWYHGQCVDIQEIDLDSIDKFHCFKCETDPHVGPSTLKPITNYHRHNQYDKNPSEKVQAGTIKFINQLIRKVFQPADDVVINLDGSQLTLPYLVKNGFDRPILIDNKEGLDLIVPPENFGVQDIMNKLTSFYELDVIDSRRQISLKMPMVDFVRKINAENRSQVLNCISLEVSKTALSELIRAPAIVNKISWVENSWSSECEFKPHVSKYCLMSMRNSYTDFHIDFGGTSVWYHLLDGEKIFYLIEPTDRNLLKYEEWMNCPDQTEIWLPDMLDNGMSDVKRLVLRKGQTLLIPTGWIHAVYTSQDSLIFGGNFLCIFNMRLQFHVRDMESRLDTPDKYMFPYFELTHWYSVHDICNFLSRHYNKKRPPSAIIAGVEALWDHLNKWYDRTKNSGEKEIKIGDFSPSAPLSLMNRLLNELQQTLKRYANHFKLDLDKLKIKDPYFSDTDTEYPTSMKKRRKVHNKSIPDNVKIENDESL